MSTTKLVDEIETAKYSRGLVERALGNMVKNDELREIKGRKVLTRVR